MACSKSRPGQGKISIVMTLIETLDIKQRKLAPLFKPGFLPREHTVFQFEFSAGEPFHLTVAETDFELLPGAHPEPTLTLLMDTHETCWALIEGRMDSMQAFMEGRFRADGHIVLSQLLLYLFKADDPTNIYEVQD